MINASPQGIASPLGIDVLADVLSVRRIGHTILCKTELAAPWGMSFDPGPRVNFHIVSRGACWLRLSAEAEPIQLVQGDVVLLPQGGGHALSDDPATPVRPYREVTARANGNNGLEAMDRRGAVLLCGTYHFEEQDRHPLLLLLPPVLHITADEAQNTSSLQDVLRLLLREFCEREPGSASVISQLLDVLLVFVVRAWLAEQQPCSAGWLGALRDPQIGKALSLIHNAPGRSWTVAAIAQEVAMSRAAFAKRFSDYVGEAPLAYVTRRRMDLAAYWLRESEQRVYAIANKVGYVSETAFSKAFTRAYGLAPARYRTQHEQRLLSDRPPGAAKARSSALSPVL